MSIDQDVIGPVLGRIPSGVFILTAKDKSGLQTGMLASWVQQASFEPPAVTVAVNRKRYLNDWLEADSDVVLNLLGESQKNYLAHFGRGFEPGEPAFEGLSTSESPAGLVVLDEALGWLQGTVRASVEGGDHTIYVVEITAGKPGANIDSEKPFVHVRKNGFGY